MSQDSVTYLAQDVDYLGFLETKLGDLAGIDTLTYELLQNADDVLDENGEPGARKVCFDITDKALIVENDGVFRDIDFARMRKIASGGKKDEEGTTGAFGVGFIAVYQITDQPEIYSSGRHWTIKPTSDTQKRIEEVERPTKGTRFVLPWAFEPQSDVRSALSKEAVRLEEMGQFQVEISKALSMAALFLKHLTELVLKRSGKTILKIVRQESSNAILIEENGQSRMWTVFKGDFSEDESRLRDAFPQIKPKRHSNIWLALPDSGVENGHLYAVLPSNTSFPMPFHINADFFPTSDRKHILFAGDYRSKWNEAAIDAAAETLALNFTQIRDLLGPDEFWRMIEMIERCYRNTEAGEYSSIFTSFWTAIEELVRTSKSIFTASETWTDPDHVRLLQQKEELQASDIFESLGIQVVHPDLRKHFGLMQQIGVKIISGEDIAEVLLESGLNEAYELSDLPKSLQKRSDWQRLYSALAQIMAEGRVSRDKRPVIEDSLGNCTLAFGKDGRVWPPFELHVGDDTTEGLFPEVDWYRRSREYAGIYPEHLIPVFGPEDAAAVLSVRSSQGDWGFSSIDLVSLFSWLEGYRGEITSNDDLISRFRDLPIWPSAKKLHPLSELYLPGDFTDPLRLTGLIDIEKVGGKREFLEAMGVRPLNFRNYLYDQIPRTFEGSKEISKDAKIGLIDLLANRLGEYRDDLEVQSRLASLPLVFCQSDAFEKGGDAYFTMKASQVLGKSYPVAKKSEEHPDAVRSFYRWLGVMEELRSDDVLGVIRKLTSEPLSRSVAGTVVRIFEHFAENWNSWTGVRRSQFSELRHLAWLPGTEDVQKLYRSGEVYATYRMYLFESQANFLAIPPRIQRDGSEFIKYLEIQSEPSTSQIVRHLLHCSEHNKEVNKEVYEVLNLNRHVEQSEINQLKGKACLLLPDSQPLMYVKPNQVYWGEHNLGSHRYQLGPQLRKYDELFNKLGVREAPEIDDYIDVLSELSIQYGKSNISLTEADHDVAMHCWQRMSRLLDDNPEARSYLFERLGTIKVIPNYRGMLRKPEFLFFEDRAGLALKFQDLLKNDVIQKTDGAWLAMEAVGVKNLSEVVVIEIFRYEDLTHDDKLYDIIQDRKSVIRRAITSDKNIDPNEVDVNILDTISYKRTSALEIIYSVSAFNQSRKTEPESVNAVLIDETLIAVQNGQRPWSAIGRELATGIKPIGEIGNLALILKEILASVDKESANSTLDELGYPPMVEHYLDSLPDSELLSDIGGKQTLEVYEDNDWQGESEGGEAWVEDDLIEINQVERETEVEKEGKTEKKPKRKKRKSRIVTYVYPEDDDAPAREQTQGSEKLKAVGEAGVRLVLEFETEQGRKATDMEEIQTNHPGYDVQSEGQEGDIRYIEVKALSGNWDSMSPAMMTANEFNEARDYGPDFWLYIVERATSDDYEIFRIKDPANRAHRYLYDHGWQSLSEVDHKLKKGGEEGVKQS